MIKLETRKNQTNVLCSKNNSNKNVDNINKKKNLLKIEIKKVMLSNLLNDKKFSLQIKADGHSPVTKRNIFQGY